MIKKKYPGYIINYSTIAVDFWPKHKNRCITHYFLTHAHTDHTQGLDSSWENAVIYCSEITKKLLISMMNIKEEYIISLEMNQPYLMKLDVDETFNVTLLDANHCPGAVMYLFEGYFGCILATGDFRYTPNMFIHSPLVNKQIETCYLDNTYLSQQFTNIPSRQVALGEIIQLIEVKKRQKSNLIFSIILKNLGKENMLVEIAKYFQTKILLTTQRYERVVYVLNFDSNFFTSELNNDVFIYVDDDSETQNDLLKFKDKTIIRIKPSAFEYSYDRRPKSLPVIIDLYAKSISTYYNIPYTDHSSYNELIEFIKKLKPKRVIPIVPELDERNICNTDINVFDEYLDMSSPLIEPNDIYLKLIESKTIIKANEPILNRDTTTKSEIASKLRPRQHRVSDLVLYSKRYLPDRKAKMNKSQIEYESSPEKSQTKKNDHQSRKLSISQEKIVSSETVSPLKKNYNLRSKTSNEKQKVNQSNQQSVCSSNKSKWIKLSEQVEVLENMMGLNTSLDLDAEMTLTKTETSTKTTETRSKLIEISKIQNNQNEDEKENANDSLITNDANTSLMIYKKKSQSIGSIRMENTQTKEIYEDEDKKNETDVSRLDISISSIDNDDDDDEKEKEAKNQNNSLMKDKENRTGSKDTTTKTIDTNKEAVIATDKQLVETNNDNKPTVESTINESKAYLNYISASLNSLGVVTTQTNYSNKFLDFLQNSFKY